MENKYWDDDENEVEAGDGFAIHPGLVIKNSILPSRLMTAVDLADMIGTARPGLNNMLNGKRDLTSDVALRISAALEYPADALMTMMTRHDLARTRAKTELVERIAQIAKAASERLTHVKMNVANENRRVRKAV